MMRDAKEFVVLARAVFFPLLAMTVGISAWSASAQAAISLTEWQSRAATIDARMTALNARVQSVLSRCSGSVPIEELSARQSQCDQEGAVLKAEMDQLMKDRADLIEQKKLIEPQ